MKRLFSFLLPIAAAAAQQVVAPTPESVGPVRGENAGNYNIVNSFETGYRYSVIDGNLGKYRSDVNYRNGIRLLGSNLTVNSRDGRGHWFDEIVLTTLGLGNDPYQASTLRVQKNGLYRYDMLWRLNEYYNPGLVIANGEHLIDTRRRWQDHDLTLFPQSKFKFRAGYSRNTQTGPALSTINLFDSTRGDEFPIFNNIRREFNEYRVGGDAEFFNVKLTFLHRWEFYKEDPTYTVDTLEQGNNTTDATTLSRFRRDEPYHGSTPAWLVNLFTERSRFAVNGRFTYSGGTRNFIFDQTALGTNRIGANQNRQTIVFGDARRPVATGDLSISVFPAKRLTIVNNTSFHNTRIDGNSFLREFINSRLSTTLVNFQFLGIRLFTNSTDADFKINDRVSVFGGYRFSDRLIRSIEDTSVPTFPSDRTAAEQTNQLRAGVAGININPVKPLRLHFEAEVGRNDRPFYPISEKNYHAISARVQYKLKNLLLATGYRQNYNVNSVTLTSYSSKARNYFAEGSWAARDWFSLDASYSRLHLDTLGGLAFFAGNQRPQLTTGQSTYVSNIHAANLGVRFGVWKRADLYAGYSIAKDVGDDRYPVIPLPFSPQFPGNILPEGQSPTTTATQLAFLTSVRTFPLSFQSPLARLSVKIHEKIRWNAGYQFYNYKEDFGFFGINQNYRAHTGYTSLLWSF